MDYISRCCEYCVPATIAEQANFIKNELEFFLDKIYVGGSAYRYKGEGEAYLHQKAIYIAPNPWDLVKALAIYSIIAAVGYLIASTGAVWIGYGLMAACAYFAIGDSREYYGGNHLKKVLDILKPTDTLPTVEWIHSTQTNKISINPTKMTANVMRGLDRDDQTAIVIYRLPPPAGTNYKALIKVYYLGSDLFLKSEETKEDIRIECNNLLIGSDIKKLGVVAEYNLPTPSSPK